MAELKRDLHESPTAVLREVLERQDALEARIKELEGLLELLNRHRQPTRENPWSVREIYALDEPRGPIE